MNEELQELLRLMEQAPGGVPTRGDIPTPTLSPETEQELTPELREKRVVLNRARGNGRITNATQFLANPEVQNALITFGQAFSNAGNYTGQPNPIDVIGNAGRQQLQSNANRAAFQAFEEGRPITESTNRFADPNVISSLLQMRQQEEQFGAQLTEEQRQFNQEIDLAGRAQDLDRDIFRNDVILRRAAQNQDAEEFNKQYEIVKREQELAEEVGQARVGLMEAQADWFMRRESGTGGAGSRESLLLRTNEFLQLLGEQEQLLTQKIDQYDSQIEDIEENLEAGFLQTTGDIFAQGFNPFTPVPEGGYQAGATRRNMQAELQKENSQLKQLKDQRAEAVEALNDTRQQQKTLRQVQSGRLGAGDEGEGTTEAERRAAEEGTGEPQPQGSLESPVGLTDSEEASQLAPGSFFTLPSLPGQVYTVNEDGTFDQVQQ